MSNIFIHVFVSSETIDYFRYMVDNYNYLANGKLKFICYTYEYDVKSVIGHTHESIVLDEPVPDDVYVGGIAAYKHFNKIKKCFENFKQNEINIIADTDTVMLVKGWDEILKRHLKKNYCVGVEYYSVWHYLDKPSFIWIAFSEKGLLGYDKYIKEPFPNKHNNQCVYIPLTKDDVKKFGYKMNTYSEFYEKTKNILNEYNYNNGKYVAVITADPGWDFPLFIDENNLKYKTLYNKGSYDGGVLLNNRMIGNHAECYLDGMLYMGHQLGGRLHKFKGNAFSNEFYCATELMISNNEYFNSHICF